MTLLLLLSALLSALTGAADPVGRAVTPASVSAGVVVARVSAPAARALAQRPVQALPRLAASMAMPLADIALPVIEPIYAARRRE